MKKKICFLMIVVLILSIITGCGGTATPGNTEASTPNNSTDSQTNEPAKKLKIGYANLGDTMQFAMDVQNSCKREAEKNGVDIVCLDNNFDPQKAIENTSALLLQGIDGLVMFNTDESTNPTVKEMCDKAGIPVITVEINMPGAPFMGADNFQSGFLVGKELGKYANELWDGEIDLLLLVELPRSGESTKQRMDSVIEGVKDQVPGFKDTDSTVIRVDGENDVLPAQQRTAEVLAAHPDAKHILIGTLNDSNALGSLNAVQAVDRESDCIIVSHGVSTPCQTNLWSEKDTCWKAGVGYFPETYGEVIIPAIIDMINGKEVPDQLHPTHLVVDKSNIEKYYPNPDK